MELNASACKPDGSSLGNVTTFHACGTTVSGESLRRFGAAGAAVSRQYGMTLVDIADGVDSAAGMEFSAVLSSLTDDDDPLLMVSQAHSPAVDRECHSILHHYARLRAADFGVGGEVLPMLQPPVGGALPAAVRFRHSATSLSLVAKRIQSPQSEHYPAISALARGTVICRLSYTFARGTTVSMVVAR